ncbi:MAG TPA: ATP-binding protein [Gemmataceae bacterium]|nr:ATP-binding protein [Gemmataceae bacterium]
MLCRLFGLSPFERALVVLCAGVELDASFAGLCGAAQRDSARPYPTFSLALAALPDPHWSAVTPAGALRRWRLIELLQQGTLPVTASPLRIDERILHFLTGVQHLDDRLAGLIASAQASGDLVPSHQILAQQLADVWRQAQDRPPLIELCGADEPTRRSVAAAGCALLNLHLSALSAEQIPGSAVELEAFVRLWEREAALTSSALYVDSETIDASDGRALAAVSRLLERTNGAVVLSGRDRWRALRRPALTFDIHKPTRAEQQTLWQGLLGDTANLNGQAHRLASQFNLHVPAIRASVRDALTDSVNGTTIGQRLWDAGRAQARPRLESLAQRIEPSAAWDDLVLPDAEKRALHAIADQVAHRATVYDAWGFGKLGARGLGISALFCGSSGTGKTMAAEVMAGALRLDLYRIDLAGVVSKYIGETEKNLRRVFEAAEDGGAILFFDEADALFGKRTEVKDSHDRYANIEINYLLQRMETYRGLAILATNRKGDLDSAFLRRIRFVVNFPFPDAAQRAEIWRRVFPASAPTEGLDWEKLSSLNLAGGNIRNIAVQAAFLAAAAGDTVHMRHLAQAASTEFAKLEKPLANAALGGWK